MKKTDLWKITIGIIMLITLVISGCSTTSTVKEAEKPAPVVEEEAPPLDYDAMISHSLITTGNNYRVKKVMEKAKSGEPVTIAYIGGSITEGANAGPQKTNCYAYRSYEAFKEKYGNPEKDNVSIINAGMSGTPSLLGMIRYNRDVIECSEQKPDLVFVEFAVNDGDDTTNGNAFESMVRDILNADNKPAVVLVFSVFKSRWNLQDRLQPVGKHYDLPMLSIKDAIVPELQEGTLTNRKFFSDDYHPGNYGHQLMADCITYLLDTIAQEETAEADIVIPEEAKIGKSFCGVQMIDSKRIPEGVTINAGSFVKIDNNIAGFKANTEKVFPDNFSKGTDSENGEFTMNLDCKNLVLVFKKANGSEFGKAVVTIDGEKTLKFDGTGGWNSSRTDVLINDTETKNHTITIKMAEGNEAKAFTIFAFGYTK